MSKKPKQLRMKIAVPRRKKPVPLSVGQVYKPKGKNARLTHRRVLALIDDLVIYAAGGEAKYKCQVRTFKRWIGARV